MQIDKSHETLRKLVDEIYLHRENIISEEDSKIQVIIRMLTDVLGWRHHDIGAERKHANGYSDFIVSSGDMPAFLIEAKRAGTLKVQTAETQKVRKPKLSGPMLKDIGEGIDQAYQYSAPEGIVTSVLTDGFMWLIFKAITPHVPYRENEAFFFPSLDAITNGFSLFYELLSNEGYSKKLYSSHFDLLLNKRNFLDEPLIAPMTVGEIRISPKSDLAFDLDQVFSAFFSRLTGQQDENMLIECFVETRESRIADLALEKIAANVLGNISPREKDVDDELKILIENAVKVEFGQTVFIVGPNGAGKSTFLERFFRKTLSPSLRRRCVVASINCLNSTGREDVALQWYTEALINSFESKIYKNGSPNWDELRGMYFSDYERRRTGVDAHLYERDPQAFREKFSQFLEKKVESDREGYLRKILHDIVHNRKCLPVIIIDNTDEFSPEFKKTVFQFSQALRRAVNHCVILMPVTDKSAWSFSKTDIYSIYKSRSFFLPTPPPREVFRRRIDFIKEKIKLLKSEKEKREYFLGKGIRLSIEDISGFASVLEEIFVGHDYTSKTIGELSNFNIRRTLDLSQRVMTSPRYKVEELVGAFIAGKWDAPDYAKFLNALLRGDYDLYRQNDNHSIFPIFQVDDKIRQSPLINIRILVLLESARKSARNIEDTHLSVQSIADYFDSMGCGETALDAALSKLLEARLVEPYDPSVKNLSVDQKIAITFSGERHLKLGLTERVFFEQMALTTAITDRGTVEKIKLAYRSDAPYTEKMVVIRQLFAQYLLQEDAEFITVPAEASQFQSQHFIIEEIGKFSRQISAENEEDSASELAAPGAESFQEGVIGIVDWFDNDKGFGFVEVEGSSENAFLSTDIIKESDVERVFDGDRLLCDIGRNAKGLYVQCLHDIEENRTNIENAEGEVIKLFPDRRYGFINIGDGRRDAFLHYSILEPEEENNLHLGQKLRVEIAPDKTGMGFQVRKIVR